MTSGSHQPARGLEVYRRLLGYTRRYWPWLVFAVLAMILQGAAEPAFAALLKPLIDGSFVEQDPWIQRWAPLFIILIFAARGIGSFFSTWFMNAVGRKVIQDLRNDVFEKLLRLPVRYYDTTSSGELLAKLLYNVEQVSAAATSVITTLIRDSIKVIGLLGYMIWVNWQLSLLFMILGPLIALIVSWVTRRFRNLSHRIQNSMGDLSHVSEELIDGHRVIRMFGGEEYERRRFHEVNERNRLLQMKMVATDAASSPIVQFIVALAIAGIVFYITTNAEKLGVTIGSFISFLAALGMMLQPIKSLTQINSALQRGIAAGESIFALLDLEEEHDTGTRVLERPRGEIDYQGVSFAYEPQKGKVLDGIDLHVPAGSTVALVGHSGSGKTTLVNLLPRFYEVGEGRILIDGTDIREYTLASLRGQIAHVGQDVTLFNDTIARNIAYGAMQDVPMDAIREAARAAHALDFIEALPQGFDTMVGENGVLLSGGQRQRLAIARALLKNAPILILDEATSALDTEAERHIQAALETLMRDRTTLVIAHRLSTIENADLIVVLAEGHIIERGTHAELLALDGHYARLHRMQFREPHHV